MAARAIEGGTDVVGNVVSNIVGVHDVTNHPAPPPPLMPFASSGGHLGELSSISDGEDSSRDHTPMRSRTPINTMPTLAEAPPPAPAGSSSALRVILAIAALCGAGLFWHVRLVKEQEDAAAKAMLARKAMLQGAAAMSLLILMALGAAYLWFFGLGDSDDDVDVSSPKRSARKSKKWQRRTSTPTPRLRRKNTIYAEGQV